MSALDLILRGGGNAEVRRRRVTLSPTTPRTTRTTSALPACTGRLEPEHHGRRNTAAPFRCTSTQSRRAPRTTFASAKIQFCLAGPIGTPAGAQLEFAFFDVNGVFTNPASTTDRIWHATFTPYVAGPADPESGRHDRGTGGDPGTGRPHDGDEEPQARRRDRLRAAGGRRAGLRRRSRRALQAGSKRIGKARTKANGKYSIRIKIKKKTRCARTGAFPRRSPGACPAPALPGVPQGCKTASLSFFAFKIAMARRKK